MILHRYLCIFVGSKFQVNRAPAKSATKILWVDVNEISFASLWKSVFTGKTMFKNASHLKIFKIKILKNINIFDLLVLDVR